MPQEVLNIIWSALGIAVTGLVGWGVSALTIWLNKKIKNQKLAALLTRVLNIVADAVKEIFQEFVESLKEHGTFNEAAQKQAKEAAMNIIQSQLTPELTEFIQSNFGDVQSWISKQIEVAIYNFKNK